MTKAKTQTIETTDEFRFIPTNTIKPSPTNPRKRFSDDSIAELATSIGDKGIIEPLIVREMRGRPGKFELVCGERRWRAADSIKLKTVPAILRELTDDQVLDIQIHENLHREDVHPMDEAFGYKFLQDKLGCTIAELALRVGKSEGYVLNRLKLNVLIDEIKEDLDTGLIPLTYALEIAKFDDPEIQKDIYDECFDTKWTGNERVPDKSNVKRFAQVQHYISNNILHLLAKAPFDRKSTELREDGLACVKCTERTGANQSLFDKEQIGKNDSCLNPTCFAVKIDKHIEITRIRVAESHGLPVDKVPLVDNGRYGYYDDGILGYYDFEIVKGDAANKKNVVEAVSVANDETFGRSVMIKRKQKSSSNSTRKSSEAELESKRKERLERKEELFDLKVADVVRLRVFKKAAEIFSEEFEYSGAGKDFIASLVAKLWSSSNNGLHSHTLAQVVQPLLQSWDSKYETFSLSSYDQERNEDLARSMPDDLLKRLIFLFTHGGKGAMQYGDYKSQTEVIEVAKQYGLDYDLFDAEERLNAAPMKHKEVFRAYLFDIESGAKDPKIPRIHSPGYKPSKQ